MRRDPTAPRPHDTATSPARGPPGRGRGAVNRPAPARRDPGPRLRVLLHRMREWIDAVPPVVLVVGVLAVAVAVVVAGGALVSEVVDEVMVGAGAGQPDDRIATWVRGLRTPGLTTFFRTVTHLSDVWFVTGVVVLVAATLLLRRQLGMAVAVLTASAGAAVITTLVKEFVGRARPPVVGRLVEAVGEAFPSGHSSQAVACYGALALVVAATTSRPAVRVTAPVVAVVVALTVGVSRVYLGVHWPSDVLSGWIVGLAWLAAVAVVSWVLRHVDRPRGWWRR